LTSAKVSKLALLIAIAGTGCRMGYEELAAMAGNDGGRAGGVAAGSGAGGSAGNGSVVAGGASGEGGTAAGDASTGGATSAGGAGGSGTSGSADAGGPPDAALCLTKAFGAHDYLLCREMRSWADARSGCTAVGMRLVRIDDDPENQWLFANANVDPGRSSLVWIGASDAAVEGEWRWTDGDLFWLGPNTGMVQNGLFAGWYSREPNDVRGNEDCGSLETKSGTPGWYDSQCSTVWPFICESL
jgi:hypothetical protein